MGVLSFQAAISRKQYEMITQRRKSLEKLFLIFGIFFLSFSQHLEGQINYRHFLLAGQQELAKENYVQAINYFNTAIYSRNEGFEAWFLRGIAKYSLGDYKGAASDFSQTIGIHPLYTRAYLYRGICYDHMEDFSRALNDFDHALKLDPFDAELFMARGETKIHIGDFDGAVKDFSSTLQLKPNDAMAYLNRGIANYLANNKAKALKDLQKSISINAYNPDAFIKRGMLYYELDSLQKSLKDYNSAILLDNSYPFTYFQRALTYLKIKDTALALRDYAKVLMLDTANALTYYNRALIEASLHNYKNALADLDKVVQINPGNIYGWFNRGVVKSESDDYAGAESDFSHALDIFPDFVGGYINRSVVRQHLGKRKEAYKDHLMAEHIIAEANNGKLSKETLYRKYADSAYFRKIIEFEGDFLSGEMKKGKIQYNRINIAPKSDFQIIVYYEPDHAVSKKNSFVYFDENITRFNADNDFDVKLAFSASDHTAISKIRQKETARKAQQVLQSGDTAGYYFIKGIGYYQQTKYKASIADYDSVLHRNATFVYAYFNRGATRFELDKLLWSERQYSQAIGISKTGFHSSRKDKMPPPQHKKALSDYNRLVNLYPALPFVYYNRANLKTSLRKFQRAIDDYSMAIRLEPKLAEAYYNRALVLLYLKENKLACKDLSKAGELGLSDAYNIIKRYCNK